MAIARYVELEMGHDDHEQVLLCHVACCSFEYTEHLTK